MKVLKIGKTFIGVIILALVFLAILQYSLNALPAPPQWNSGWGDNLNDVYASIFVDAWWTPGTDYTGGNHHIYIYNGEARAMSYTWKMHHELVGYANKGGIYRLGDFGTVDADDYARETGWPYLHLSNVAIRDFPGEGTYTVHSRTGVEVYNPLATHQRDSWEVQTDYEFRYIPAE